MAASRDRARFRRARPLLLGLPGLMRRMPNYAEAKPRLLPPDGDPAGETYGQALAHWLGPAYGRALVLEPDLDAIEALAQERESLWAPGERRGFLDGRRKKRRGGRVTGVAGGGHDDPGPIEGSE